MSTKNKENTATEAVVVLPQDNETANVVVDPVVEEISVDAVIEEIVAIEVLLPLAGKFLLPYDPGAVIEIGKNQATEIVEAGYGKFVTE